MMCISVWPASAATTFNSASLIEVRSRWGGQKSAGTVFSSSRIRLILRLYGFYNMIANRRIWRKQEVKTSRKIAICIWTRNRWKVRSQCWGSGSLWFWASRIRTRHYFVRIWSLPSTSKTNKKTLISTPFWLLFDFLSLKNDVSVPSKSNKKKIIFSRHRVSPLTKHAWSGSGLWSRIRIRICMSVVRIRGSGSGPKCHGSTTLGQCLLRHYLQLNHKFKCLGRPTYIFVSSSYHVFHVWNQCGSTTLLITIDSTKINHHMAEEKQVCERTTIAADKLACKCRRDSLETMKEWELCEDGCLRWGYGWLSW